MRVYEYEGKRNISGERIHQRRTTLIEREAISKIETGDRFVTDYEFIVFAEVLGVSMEWLAGQE